MPKPQLTRHTSQQIKVPTIWVNAEFQRLLWLSWRSGLAIGIVVIYLLFIFSFLNNKDITHEEISFTITMIGIIGLLIGGLSILILLNRSLKNDFDSNTFDQLRMSSLSAWQMTYSRLLIAPIMGWLTFIIGWLLLGFNLLYFDKIAEFWSLWLIIPFIAWSWACLVLCNSLQRQRGQTQWTGSTIQVVLFIIILQLFQTGLYSRAMNADMVHYPSYMIFLNKNNTIINIFNNIGFAIFITIATHAAMAWRLHLRPANLTFLCLCLASPIFTYGMGFDKTSSLFNLAFNYGALGILSLIIQDTRYMQNGFESLKNGEWYIALQQLPAWVILFPLGVIICISLNILLIPEFIYILVLGGLIYMMRKVELKTYNTLTVSLGLYIVLRFLLFILTGTA